MWRRVPNQLRETLIRCRSDPTVTSSQIPRNPTSSQSAMKPSCLFSHQFSSDTIVAKKVMPIAIGHEREPAAQQTQIGFRTGSSTSHSLSFYKTPGQELFKMGMVKPALLTRCITTDTEAPVSQNTIPDVPPPRIKFKRLDKQARHIMQTWLEKWPEKAAFIRLAGEGSWFHQFRAVVLLRISPFPFIIYNYAAVATNVKYCPYILGSVVGVIPEIFVAIYSGILIRQLADASHESHQYLSPTQIIYNGLGFITTVETTVAITIYAKKALKKLKNEEE